VFANRTSAVATIRLVLIPIFVAVLILGSGGTYLLLRHDAIVRATENARLLLNTAVAIRAYTQDRVLPDVSKAPTSTFYETSVPAFAAQDVYKRVQGMNPAYSYREPALNPTNPADRPTAVEVELINRFRAEPKLDELTGIRDSEHGAVFYLARPIRITNRDCLVCHSTPDKAPPAMIAKYGPTNGFGWQLNEAIGIQTLTVPIAEQLKGSVELAISLAAGLLLVFVVTYFALTYVLQMMLVRPLRELTAAADAASVTTTDRAVVAASGTKEIQDLGDAIQRLRTSLMKALRRLGSPGTPQE
jgi:HAMP domain-containing protein